MKAITPKALLALLCMAMYLSAFSQFTEKENILFNQPFTTVHSQNTQGWNWVDGCYKAWVTKENKYYMHLPQHNRCHDENTSWGYTYVAFPGQLASLINDNEDGELSFNLQIKNSYAQTHQLFGFTFNHRNINQPYASGDFFILMLTVHDDFSGVFTISEYEKEKWQPIISKSKTFTVGKGANNFRIAKKGVTYHVYLNGTHVFQFGYKGHVFDRILYSVGEYFLDDVQFTTRSHTITVQRGPTPSQHRPTTKVMLVGIEDYRNHAQNVDARNKGVSEADFQLPQLQFAIDDCQALAEYWLRGSKTPLPDNQVATLTGNVTGTALLNKASTFFANMQEEDVAILYLSGHGLFGSFCAADDDVTYGKLNEVLEKVNARKKIVFIDACHAAAMEPLYLEGSKSPGDNSVITKLYYDAITQSSPGIAYVLSCEAMEKAWEFPDLSHSVFAYYLLRALQGSGNVNADNDSFITLGEVIAYLKRNVYDKVYKSNKKDTKGRTFFQNVTVRGDFDPNLPLALVE